MPKRTKKLLIYLDQNFISEIAKAGIKDRVKPEWRQLFELLKEGFLDEKLVVPQSRFHNVETSLAPALKKRIVSYQNYLGQVDLQSPEHVKHVQTGRFLQRFLGTNNEDPFRVEVAFRGAPDKRVEQFHITVDLDWSPLGQGRGATAAHLETIKAQCIADKVRYKAQLEKELGAERDHFLKRGADYAYLCQDPMRELVAFSKDPVFRAIPVVSIAARLWASLLTKDPTRKVQPGDATDIEVLATYLPYMDVVGTDAFMATKLATLGIDTEYNTLVFSGKTSSLQVFRDFLRDYLHAARPANQPAISVFVLPSLSVKEKAFRLFFDLGAAARLFGVEEYATIYGFDDGAMPRYKLSGEKLQVPFYGLQEVYPIKIESGTTIEATLEICRKHCRSKHFIVVDEYRPVKDTFLVGAAMSAETGMETFEGCRIYPKRRNKPIGLAVPPLTTGLLSRGESRSAASAKIPKNGRRN